jgi:hypothetical protein
LTNQTKKRKIENMKNSEIMSLIEDELAGVIALYDQLIEQSDKLAEAIYYQPDYILGKVMPNKASERRNSSRISEWFNKECKPDLLDHIAEIEAQDLKTEAREKLLASLNLTDEQKALLFED